MTNAVLSPHPDDAVLSCWHLLTDPGDVMVINVFTAAPAACSQAHPAWWDRLTGASSSPDRMRDRLAEDAEALGHAGRKALHLGFLDGQYRTEEQSVHAIVERLAAVLDPAMRVYAPAALGAVPDHDVVRAAGVMLERRGYEVAFYADLPHAIQFGWPASVTGLPRDDSVDVDAYWEALIARSIPNARDLRMEIHDLDECAQTAKLAAVQAYRTQLPSLVALNGRLAEPGTLRYEATWRRPQLRNGEVSAASTPHPLATASSRSLA